MACPCLTKLGHTLPFCQASMSAVSPVLISGPVVTIKGLTCISHCCSTATIGFFSRKGFGSRDYSASLRPSSPLLSSRICCVVPSLSFSRSCFTPSSSIRDRRDLRNFCGSEGGRGQVVCEQSVDELPPKLQSIVRGFQSVPDPRARYQQLLHYAARLKPLAAEHRIEENKVIGCVSQVWVLPSLGEDGSVSFQADSDSALTKGLAALLVEGLSGSPPAAILAVQPDFIQQLGLKQSLTPSRNSGFLNMLKLMQRKTLELYMQSEAAKAAMGSAVGGGREAATAAGAAGARSLSEATGGHGTVAGSAAEGGANGAGVAPSSDGAAALKEAQTSGTGASDRPIYDSMRRKLSEQLATDEVEVEDVSYQHAGHAGVRGAASAETHFNVKVVTPAFAGLSTIKRHRMVYALLQEEFDQGLHALSLVTKTPEEMAKAAR
eukprot:TRINITY_DN29990_c0_g1_i1.p1 TRINITY_DN29990_c0_g1~~TRINITY_DN29990_c0_g1_i1.p1  ORF type:complete len:435 (-),score=66.08 TRINITY_DN29990_c0_g1_i1:288-1592(-)